MPRQAAIRSERLVLRPETHEKSKNTSIQRMCEYRWTERSKQRQQLIPQYGRRFDVGAVVTSRASHVYVHRTGWVKRCK